MTFRQLILSFEYLRKEERRKLNRYTLEIKVISFDFFKARALTRKSTNLQPSLSGNLKTYSKEVTLRGKKKTKLQKYI